MSSVATKTRKTEDYGHGPTIEKMVITPAMAADMLTQNVGNRPASKREISRLATIMRAGEWRLNGESIKFDWNQHLRDGQHRLGAVVESETAIETYVIRDLDPSTFSTMDQGRSRSTGDILSIAGTPRAKAAALAVATFYRIIRDKPIHGAVDKIPPYGALEILRRHPGIIESIEHCVPLYNDGEKPVSLGMLGAYHYLVGHILSTRKVADNLINSLAMGIDLDQGSPVRHFRAQILDHRSRKGVMHGQAKAAFLAKAIGMELGGVSVQRHLRKPSARETYWSLLPGLEEAVSRLEPREAMVDLAY